MTAIVWVVVLGAHARAAPGDTTGGGIAQIDGANGVAHGREFPSAPGNGCLIRRGLVDPAPFWIDGPVLPGHGFTGRSAPGYRAAVWGAIGAEVGDGLLNRVDYNRDHRSDAGFHLRIPKVHLDLAGRYRYVDTYSDRFDSLRSQYGVVTGRSMVNAEDGLIKDYTIAYGYGGERVRVGGVVAKYLGWRPTPYFFSPLYSSGVLTSHAIDIGVPPGDFGASLLADSRYTSYDHTDSLREPRLSIALTWGRRVARRLSVHAETETHRHLSPTTRVTAGIGDSSGNPVAWHLWGGVYEDGNVLGGGSAGLHPLDFISVEGSAGWYFEPRERDYTFLEFGDTVSYRQADCRGFTVHVSTEIRDTLRFPLVGSVWYDLNNAPVWESIDTGSGTTVIQRQVLPDAVSSVGGRLLYELGLGPLSADLWMQGHVVLGDRRLPLDVPWNCGAALTYGNRDSDTLFGSLEFNISGPVRVAYYRPAENTHETLQTDPHASLSMKLKIPFLLPILRHRLRSRFWVEAGPVNLSDKTRIRRHPRGNPIGPMILVRYELVLR